MLQEASAGNQLVHSTHTLSHELCVRSIEMQLCFVVVVDDVVCVREKLPFYIKTWQKH